MNAIHKISNRLALLLIVVMVFACDDGFEDVNRNPTQSDNLDPIFLLAFVQNKSASERFETWRGNLIYTSQWAQQLSGDWGPDRYITTNEDWLSAYWNEAYGKYMRNVTDIIDREETSNVGSMGKIMKVLIMQRITDMYGDIPFSQANRPNEFAQPVYDTQESIYNDFIATLKDAVSNLAEGNGNDPGSNDIYYGGDISKWRKLGNSLLLRVGMRLSEVNPSLAQQTVQEALAGGVFTGNEDIAYVAFDGSNIDGPNASGVGEVFQDFGITGHQFRYSDEFVSRIIDNNDPRETILMETYTSEGEIDATVGPGNHVGRPNGIQENPFEFAQPRREVMVAYNSPVLMLTFAEVEFLRAEAIVRGWATGDPRSAYESGIRAACQHLALYPNTSGVDDAAIDAFLTEPGIAYNANRAIEQINTQKWIALIFDGFEAYANYRRIGFPELTPGEVQGESDGTIPKRMRYPTSESLTNTANYNEAVSRMSGGDVIRERVWWDVN